MTDLAALQKQLNADAELRRQFVKSPVAFLEKRGLKLPTEVQKQLRAMVAQLKKSKPGIAGASVKGITPMHTILISVDAQAAKKK